MTDSPPPLVSVVVPAHNEERGIARCIESLMALDFTGAGVDIVVIDNGSSDGTGRVIGRYPVRRVAEPRKGPAAARNAGIRAARGAIVAFTDADCIVGKSWLGELLAGADDPGVGCFAGEFAAQPDRRIVAAYVEDKRLICQKKLLSSTPPAAAAGNVAYRRAVFDAVGMFDESFLNGEDGELYRRMSRHGGFSTRYNPKAIVYHRHPATLGHLWRRSYREGVGVSAVRLRHPGDFPPEKRSARFYWKTLAISLAGMALCPLRALAYGKSGTAWRKSIVYPLLDKACSLAFVAGVLEGLRGSKGREGSI